MNGVSCKPPIHIDLDRDSLIVVPDEFEIVVRCKSGALWITQLGNPHDLAIYAGESMVVRKGNDSIINAVTAASVEMYLPYIQQRQLTLDFSLSCYELRYAATKQALKVKGKCRIRLTKNGSAICVQ